MSITDTEKMRRLGFCVLLAVALFMIVPAVSAEDYDIPLFGAELVRNSYNGSSQYRKQCPTGNCTLPVYTLLMEPTPLEGAFDYYLKWSVGEAPTDYHVTISLQEDITVTERQLCENCANETANSTIYFHNTYTQIEVLKKAQWVEHTIDEVKEQLNIEDGKLPAGDYIINYKLTLKEGSSLDFVPKIFGANAFSHWAEFRVDPDYYIFYDSGDIKNDGFAGVSGQNLTTGGWRASTAAYNAHLYNSTTTKLGNTSITHHELDAKLSFSYRDFGVSLGNLTCQFAVYPDSADIVDRVNWGMQLNGVTVAEMGVRPGLTTNDTRFWLFYGGSHYDSITPIATTWFNSTFYLNDTHIDFYINGFLEMHVAAAGKVTNQIYLFDTGAIENFVYDDIACWNGTPEQRPQEEVPPPPIPAYSNALNVTPEYYSPTGKSNFSITWSAINLSTVRILVNISGVLTDHAASNTSSTAWNLTIVGIAAGTHYWQSNATTAQDGTNTTPWYAFTIAQAAPTLALTLDGTAGNVIIGEGDSIWLNGSVTTGDSDYTLGLWVDGAHKGTGSSAAINNYTLFDTPGTFNVSLNYTTTGNYTYGMVSYFVQVNASPVMNTSRINSETNLTGTPLELFCNATDVEGDNVAYEIRLRNSTSTILAFNYSIRFMDTGAKINTSWGGFDAAGSKAYDGNWSSSARDSPGGGAAWIQSTWDWSEYSSSDGTFDIIFKSYRGGVSAGYSIYLTNYSDGSSIPIGDSTIDYGYGCLITTGINTFTCGNISIINDIWNETNDLNLTFGLTSLESPHYSDLFEYNLSLPNPINIIQSVETNVYNYTPTEPGNYTLGCRAFDGLSYSGWLNSTPLEIPDGTPPAYSNALNVTPGTFDPTSQLNLSLTWEDNVDVTGAWFEVNRSGTSTTYTASNISTTYNLSLTGFPVGTHYWRSNATDAAGNVNTTPWYSFTIAQIASTINLTLDGTEGNVTILQYESIWLNGTLLTGDTGSDLVLYVNTTQIASEIAVANYTAFNTIGLYNITLIYAATGNYSAAETTYYVNVTDTGQEITFAPHTYTNKTGIPNFSVYLLNSTTGWNETRNSTGNYVNWTCCLTNGTYEVQINASNYFIHGGTLTVTNSSASYAPDMWAAEYRVLAKDSLSSAYLTSFTVLDQFGTLWNSSGNTTVLYLDAHQWNLTILKTGYVDQSWLYTATNLSNATTTRTIIPKINYSLIDEATLLPYDVASTTSTTLDVFCTNETIHGDFKEEGNASSIYFGVSCDSYMVKVTIEYNGSSYYRTLVPAATDRAINFYMVDLSTDIAVQRIINLVDLTGDYSEGELRVMRYLSGAFQDIIRQPFDIEDSVTLYLMKDELYVLSLFNNAGVERSLGNLIADVAGEQTVTFPKIEFYPEAYVGETISWEYSFNASAGLLRVQYEDTDNITTGISFKVLNESGYQLFYLESNSSDVTITYNGIVENQTYISTFEIVHPFIDAINESKIWASGHSGFDFFELAGWDDATTTSIQKAVSFIILIAWLMFFARKHTAFGGASACIMATLLKWMGWFPISAVWLGIAFMLAIIALIAEGVRQ